MSSSESTPEEATPMDLSENTVQSQSVVSSSSDANEGVNSATDTSSSMNVENNNNSAGSSVAASLGTTTASASTSTMMPTNTSAIGIQPPPPSTIYHADAATPASPQPSMEPIQSIAQRLLGLRGSPPGTLASLAENEIKLLCQRVRPILLSQPMLLELEAPLKICGDIHGQFTDLLNMLNNNIENLW